MKFRPLIITLIFFCLWTYVGFNLSQLNSPTFDEPIHLHEATLYQKGQFSLVDPMETPLLRRFVFFTSQFLSPRNIVTISTGLLASILIYYLGSTSIFSGFVAAILFLSEPNLLSAGSFFTTDALASFLTVITTLLILKDFWKKPWQLGLLSLLVGFSAASKISTLSLLGPLLLIKFPRLKFKRLFIISLASCFIIWATYDFRLELPIRQFPFPIPLGGYLRAIKENLQFARRGQPLYFFEELFFTGPWYKQPLVFLLKTPPLQLFLFLFSGKYLLPLFLILLVNVSVGLHFGIRHLLTAEIFIILATAQIKLKRTSLKILLFLLMILQLSSVYSFLPQLTTYANPLAGKSPNRIFTDSDYDWGQGLISLKSALKKKGISTYQLAYFGNVDPTTYLGKFIRITDSNQVGSQPIAEYDDRIKAIISITCYYQCGYYLDPRFPIGRAEVIAQSFLLFDSND